MQASTGTRMSRRVMRATAFAVALVGGAAVWPGASQAGTLTTLYSFTGGSDGSTPYKGVTLDSAGNIYGTAFYGADACPDSYEYAGVGCGVVYKIDTSNTFSVLATFTGAKNGANPDSNLTLKGKLLYGAAFDGGKDDVGTIYRLETSGAGLKTLYSFSGPDGSLPDSYPRIDPDGNIFSVTQYGGPDYVSGQQTSGFGVLFELQANGKSYTYVAEHPFSGGTDGGIPGRVFFDANYNLIGGTAIGGSCSGGGLPSDGCGVIYEMTPDTGQFQVLYTFTGGSDGYSPELGGFDKSGNLYGATLYGGANGDGTLFELKPNGSGGYTYVHLYDFTGGNDGYEPVNPAVEGNGTLIGTTELGPSSSDDGDGVLYQFKKGKLTTLNLFTNDANGGYPFGTPYVTTSGTIYGVATYGGVTPCDTSGGTLISSYGCGTVYEYTP